jgi:hypothetical protein
MASLYAEVSITRLTALDSIKFCCLRADELTVPAIANTSAIANRNTSASASVTTSGSDGLKSECAMGSSAESRVIIFFLEGCVNQLAILFWRLISQALISQAANL